MTVSYIETYRRQRAGPRIARRDPGLFFWCGICRKLRIILLYSDSKILYNIRQGVLKGGLKEMCEKELSICIGIHHIATVVGVLEGIYYLFTGRQKFWKSCVIFLMTVFQSFAGLKIIADLRRGRSRLTDRCRRLKRLGCSRRQEKGVLWGIAALSALFKTVPVHFLACD